MKSIISVFLLFCAVHVHAQDMVFKCLDANGKTTFTNQSCPDHTKRAIVVQDTRDQNPSVSRQTAAADRAYIQRVQAENQRKAQERAHLASSANRPVVHRTTSTKDIHECKKWQREEQIVRNLIKPEPGRLNRATRMVDKYC